MPPMPQTQPRRHDLGADPPRRRPGSGGARAGLGGGRRAGSGRASAGSRRASAGAPPEASVRSEGFSFGRDETARRETTPRDASASLGGETHGSAHSPRGDKSSRPESGESAGSGGSRASSGVTSGVSDVSVLSFRDRDSSQTKTAYAVRERLVKAPKAPKALSGRKPPVSASGVHGSGSRLRAMQREAARERSARTADRGIDPRLTVHTHAYSHRSPSTERHRGGSARVSGPRSPHSPARRRPPVVTPEAFVIARPGT